MFFTVDHITRYLYSAPVRLGPHAIRLGPRAGQGRVISEQIVLLPEPSVRREVSDHFGNRVTEVEFSGETPEFRVSSRFEIETEPAPWPELRLPPLPWTPEPDLRIYLAANDAGPEIFRFADGILRSVGGSAVDFLDALTAELFTRTDRHIRPAGYAQTPSETLTTARGACRDITVLFMAAARSLGLPARFVSGYQAQADTPDGQRHLHAWPEVHLPGAGWRGYDPTHGTRIGAGHVALCAAPDQARTMPIEGSFWGGQVQVTFAYKVDIATRG